MIREKKFQDLLFVASLLFIFLLIGIFFNIIGGDNMTSTSSIKDSAWFREVAVEKEINYTSIKQQPGVRGDVSNSGVYIADYNNDFQSDMLAIGGKEPVLYENVGGEFKKSNKLPELYTQYVRTALFFDHNNDGWVDLLLFPHNSTPIFLHNDHGKFEIKDIGIDIRFEVPLQATVADYDHDGCLDLFVIQNGDWKTDRPARLVNNQSVMDYGNGNPNFLFDGNCSSFELVATAGIKENHWSLAASFVDLNGDGWSDIHVANDFNYDALYINKRNGSFERVELNATNRNGMASEIADITGDGRPDIFVTNIYWTENAEKLLGKIGYATGGQEGNNLLINRGGGHFVGQAETYRVRNGRWGWAAIMADFDNDRDMDIFHTTRGKFLPVITKQIDTSGLSFFKQPRFFEKISDKKFISKDTNDIGFKQTDGRGAAQLDFDSDGDLDIVVAQAQGKIRLYENKKNNHNSIQILVIDENGSIAHGAKVYITAGNKTQVQILNAKADFLSQSSQFLHFGVGEYTEINRIRIIWSDGTKRVFEDMLSNRKMIIGPNKVMKINLNSSMG